VESEGTGFRRVAFTVQFLITAKQTNNMKLSQREYDLMFGTLVATYSFIGNSPSKAELGQLIKKLDPKVNQQLEV
jgi:hypothetical protein